MKKSLSVLLITCSLQTTAQNLFPVKLNNCKTESFCLDCGDKKAGYDEEGFRELIARLNESVSVAGMQGSVKFQLLIDAKGKGCVLSHTDLSKNPLTLRIIKAFNSFRGWTPAVTNNKVSEKTSINIVVSVRLNQLDAKIERVDMEAFEKSFDRPTQPEIFNTTYVYKNESLKNYKLTVWNSKNSALPNNHTTSISIDNTGRLWLSLLKGLVTFDGQEFKNAEQNITAKGKFFTYDAIATDNSNTKWVSATNNIYSFDNEQWKKYDSAEIGIDDAYDIINNPQTGEVFFCSNNGLTIYKDGKWSNLNTTNTPELPSNRISFARRDSKNRIWIGTYSGSVMIDEKAGSVSFEKTNTVLKGKTITSMDEDENGNLYFSLYEFDRKDKKKVNNDEGIAIRYNDGRIRQFTTANSGMPFNHATCVLYDKNERVLWISTDRAGLVRFNLKDEWENYHNENSEIPTSHISDMEFDRNGNLFLATRQGLVKIERR